MNNLYKKVLALTMAAVLSLLVSCGQTKSFSDDITCEQILNEAKSVDDKAPENATVYSKNGVAFDGYTMSLYADGTYEACEDINLLDDYAVFYSSDNTTYEISVLKAKSKDDVAKLHEILNRRKETLSSGDKAEYDPNFDNLMKNSQILTDGEFVILLITENNDNIIKAIENLKQ